jgi:hypothetical protein
MIFIYVKNSNRAGKILKLCVVTQVRIINPITCEPHWGALFGDGIDNAQCLSKQKKKSE